MNTVIKQAETFRRVLKLTYVEDNSLPDLTGCIAYSQMRKTAGGALLGDAICNIDNSQGTISALWSKEQTADWSLGVCGFDIWLKCGEEQKPIYTEQCQVMPSYTVIPEE